MYRLLTLCLMGFSLATCKKDEYQVNETFIFLLQPTQAACTAAQPGGMFINCHQSIQFKNDSKVDVMYTDIIHQGTYKRDGDRIMIDLGAISSFRIEFEIESKNRLKEIGSGNVWRRYKGPTVWDLY